MKRILAIFSMIVLAVSLAWAAGNESIFLDKNKDGKVSKKEYTAAA